jgi:hypothetical protein
MNHDWILDVLTDLTTFARSNGLDGLAQQLDDTQKLALTELASRMKGQAIGLCGNDATTGHDPARIGASRSA